MQHWLAHIGTIHTLQQGVTIAGHLSQAQYKIDVLVLFPQLLDASVIQYSNLDSNLGEHFMHLYNATTFSSLLIQAETVAPMRL